MTPTLPADDFYARLNANLQQHEANPIDTGQVHDYWFANLYGPTGKRCVLLDLPAGGIPAMDLHRWWFFGASGGAHAREALTRLNAAGLPYAPARPNFGDVVDILGSIALALPFTFGAGRTPELERGAFTAPPLGLHAVAVGPLRSHPLRNRDRLGLEVVEIPF